MKHNETQRARAQASGDPASGGQVGMVECPQVDKLARWAGGGSTEGRASPALGDERSEGRVVEQRDLDPEGV